MLCREWLSTGDRFNGEARRDHSEAVCNEGPRHWVQGTDDGNPSLAKMAEEHPPSN